MQSVWSKTTDLPKQKELKGNIHIQNVVIGAGMAGILTAYFLQKKGLEVIVIEADKIAGGQTKDTTAKITSQHGLIYHDMMKKTGKSRAKGYAQANETAIKAYEEIIREEGITCHYEKLSSFLYSTREDGKELLVQEARAAVELGIKAHYMEGDKIHELPFEVSGAVCFENQAQFHPLEFFKALTDKLTIYENTNAIFVHGHIIATNRGTIEAENIIFATHYPFINVPGFYFLRQHQERSYVLALKGRNVPEKMSAMYYGIDEGGLSFRCAEGNLLLGGGSHRTGKRVSHCENKGYSYLREQAHLLYPQAEETTYWAAQDCMPHDGIPFIGRYSFLRPYWYVATGFHKWGMTSSMISAMIIRDMICGKQSPYEEVFTPQRLLFRAGIKDLCVDIGESVVGLTKGLFSRKETRCSHMGCHLTWNEEEKSWDCPCHGSRYDNDRKLIDNPAQRQKPRK
ncbi:MAG: FAD-dependent oxidoreductase [Lachnospiraceae bacterium]|nr:FAD-dependent oxidoreductase [Lachnospiraceae bacterium]